MRRLYLILIILLVFVAGSNVCQNTIVLAVTVVLCCFSLPDILFSRKNVREARRLLIFMVLYWIFQMLYNGSTGSRKLGIIMYLPVFVYLVFASHSIINYKIYRKFLYGAYILECTLAILEYVFKTHFFRMAENADVDKWSEFRSLGLYGHPLQNALVVLVFLLFILEFENRLAVKTYMSSLGIIAIACFNARFAMVMSVLCYLLYYIKLCVNSNISKAGRTKMVFFLCFFFLIGAYLFLHGHLGDRLLNNGLYDDSAAVRLEVFNIFESYNLRYFMFGLSLEDNEFVRFDSGISAVENFWFNILLSYGLVFILGLIFFYYSFYKHLFEKFSLSRKLFLFVPFIVVASSNPSLAVSAVPMTAFLLLCHIMPECSDVDNYCSKVCR